MKKTKEDKIRKAIHETYKLLVNSGSHTAGIVNFKNLYQTAKEITSLSLSEFKFVMRKLHAEHPERYIWSRAPELLIDKRYRIDPYFWGFSIKEES